MMRDFISMLLRDQLKELGMFILEKRLIKHMIGFFTCLKGYDVGKGLVLFCSALREVGIVWWGEGRERIT